MTLTIYATADVLTEAREHLAPLQAGDAQAIGSLLRLMERARQARTTFEAAQCAYEIAQAEWFNPRQDKGLARAAYRAHEAATALYLAESPLDRLLLAWETVQGSQPFPGVTDGRTGDVWTLTRLPDAEGVRVTEGSAPWVAEECGA